MPCALLAHLFIFIAVVTAMDIGGDGGNDGGDSDDADPNHG